MKPGLVHKKNKNFCSFNNQMYFKSRAPDSSDAIEMDTIKDSTYIAYNYRTGSPYYPSSLII